MARLGLREEDLDNIVFEQEGPPPAESKGWMVVGKVCMDMPYNQYWFFKNMRSAWDLTQEVNIHTLDENLYAFQLICLGDWE